MYNNLNDEELIKLVAEKDTNAFNELYNRYEKLIYNYLNKLVFDKDMLDEIFQEVFTKIYIKADTFKIKYSFKSWVYKIAMNQYIDYYKKLKRMDKYIEQNEEMNEIKYNAPDIIDNIIRKESLELLNKLLNQLPEKYQQAVMLKKIEGFTFKEIANIMGVTARSVKTYVSKGIELLKNKFNKR